MRCFGVTAVADPNAASSKAATYSLTARLAFSGALQVAPSIPLWLLASALIRLPSTAKPSPPTNPSSMQCDTHHLEHAPKEITLAEAPMTVLRKSGMIRYAAIKTEPTEPAIRQVQMDLAAQSAFRTDAKAIADKQHADHQFRINRWPAECLGMTRRRRVRADVACAFPRQPKPSTQERTRPFFPFEPSSSLSRTS